MIFANGVQRLFESIAAINIKTTRMTQRKLREFDLTYPQFGALFVLISGDGLSQIELAELLDTDPTTTMVICEGLERKGMLKRIRTKNDRRTYRLMITDLGRKTLTHAAPAVESIFSPLAQALSADEVSLVLPVLERIESLIRHESQ